MRQMVIPRMTGMQPTATPTKIKPAIDAHLSAPARSIAAPAFGRRGVGAGLCVQGYARAGATPVRLSRQVGVGQFLGDLVSALSGRSPRSGGAARGAQKYRSGGDRCGAGFYR